MQFTMTATHGPIADAMPYARKCERKAIYGAAKEAMRAFKKYRAHGRLFIKSVGGRLCAMVSYSGSGDVKVVYYERGSKDYHATREDVCEIKRQSILTSRVYPPSITRSAKRLSFVGMLA